VFLSDSPDNEAKNELLRFHNGPEELFITDEAFYVNCINRVVRSKLYNALIERTLNLSGTARNWNTVTKLLELAET
jgi:uncharacterized protein (DUF1697 family)